MHYHYTFRTYKGKSTLIDAEIKKFLSNAFVEISKEKSFEILAFSVLEDHVHMLINQSSDDSTNYIMRMIKGISSRKLFRQFPTNRLEHRKLWGRGYYAKKVLQPDIPAVIAYINNQIGKDGFDKRYNRWGSPIGSNSTPKYNRRGLPIGLNDTSEMEPRRLVAGSI